MRRPGLIAALLLPFPIAALPLLALLFTSGGPADTNGGFVADTSAIAELDVAVSAAPDVSVDPPMNYTTRDGDCGRDAGVSGDI